jgi:putative hemolysin
VPLHGELQFCDFAASTGDSHISLDLATLWSTEPTLATLAYYEPSPPHRATGGQDPASAYCVQLGGASNFDAVTGEPGAWATEDAGDGSEPLVSYCVFPDRSVIDLEGLAAHVQGEVLGIDLRTVFHYRPERLPVIYPDAEPYETTAPGVPALPMTPNALPDADPEAAAYCQEQGGRVLLHTYFYGTNNERDQWLQLATPLYFCEFDAQEGSSADPDSHIALDLETLYSEEPALAAMAYRAAIPIGDVPPAVNPAPIYCSQLGGSSKPTGADNVVGGGWVNEDEPVFNILAMCVFADGSMIEEWGLTYHSNGAIRGIDLDPILRD